MGLLRLLVAGGFAGADGPDRFVGDDDLVHLLGGDILQPCRTWRAERRTSVRLALFEGFADAEDGGTALRRERP